MPESSTTAQMWVGSFSRSFLSSNDGNSDWVGQLPKGQVVQCCALLQTVPCKLLLNTTAPIRVKGRGSAKQTEEGVLCKETDMMHLGWYDP